MKVFLCGEGPNELGSWSGHPAWQHVGRPGVLEALLRRVRRDGWEVGGGIEWKEVRAFRTPGRSRPGISARFAQLGQLARDRGCDAVVLVLDREDTHTGGLDDLDTAAAKVAFEMPGVAAMAVPCIEGWILALHGVRRSETLGAKAALARLAEHGIEPKNTAAYVLVCENDVAEDASGLLVFLREIGSLLP